MQTTIARPSLTHSPDLAQLDSPRSAVEARSAPRLADAQRLGHTLAATSTAAPIQCQRNRKRWTDAQREQSRKFWEKKNRRIAARKASKKAAFENRLARKERDELPNIRGLGRVTAPGGGGPAMPARQGVAVAPHATATMKFADVMHNVGGFLHPNHPVRSQFNAGGPQFIQEFDQQGTKVTRRVGVDVEPSSHVNRLRPHLNLQTQHDGEIQGGLLADPHHPVATADPFANHPLAGMQPEEQRKFMERYLRSSGIPVERR